MSVDLSKIQQCIYTWIATELRDTDITPDKIVWKMQDAPRPSRPYFALDFVSGPNQVGHDELREITPGKFTVCGERAMTVSIDAYGDQAMALVFRVHSSLAKPTIQSIFQKYDVGLQRQEDVTDRSIKLETKFETRFGFDVIINVASNTTDEPGFIETVEVTDLINGEPV